MSVFFVFQLSTIFYEDDYDIKLENMESHPDSHGDNCPDIEEIWED